MATTDALLLNKIDCVAASVLTNELNAGFSTPPSSSLDTCDSGFTELYSNNFTLINSTKELHDKAPTFENMDLENKIECHPVMNKEDETTETCETGSNIDREDKGDSGVPTDDNAETNSDENGYGDDDSDDYDDAESNSSDMSDLSDVFKLNADVAPEMQRSLNWVCDDHASYIRDSSIYLIIAEVYFIEHGFFVSSIGSPTNSIRR